MRFPSRRALFLLIVYLVGVVALYAWVADRLERAAWDIMEETARLLGHEVSVAVAQSLIDGRPGARPDVMPSLAAALETVRRSPMVDTVAVVGAGGQVIASRGAESAPARLPPPAELFGRDRRPRLVGIRANRLSRSQFLLDVPVMRSGQPLAYLHLSLNSRRISQLYGDARHTLLLSSALGLVVIGGLGFALHLQLVRRERMVVSTLEGVLAGRPIGAAGAREVPLILSMAERLGDTLRAERSRTVHAHQSLAYLSRVLDVGVVLASPTGEVEYVGPRARPMLGLDGGAGDADRLAALFEGVREALELASSTGQQAVVDLAVGEGESRRELRCYVQPFVEADIPAFVLILRDKAVLQALETDLRQAAQLRWLGRFYVGAAHDLKAPLNALVLNVEVLKQSLESGEPDDAELETRLACVAALESDLGRLRRAFDNLLVQASPPQPVKEAFDLRELIGEVEGLIRHQARHQRTSLVIALSDEPIEVHASRDVIKQAVLNLAINALEALTTGGELTLRAGVRDGEAVLEVLDTGPGVPEEVQARIFDLHVSTKATGTGIGLYVARAAAEDEEGSLRLASTGPRGTSFELALPLAGGGHPWPMH